MAELVQITMAQAEYAEFKKFVCVTDPAAVFVSYSMGENEQGEPLLLVDVTSVLPVGFFEVCIMVGMRLCIP